MHSLCGCTRFIFAFDVTQFNVGIGVQFEKPILNGNVDSWGEADHNRSQSSVEN